VRVHFLRHEQGMAAFHISIVLSLQAICRSHFRFTLVNKTCGEVHVFGKLTVNP